MNYLDIIISVPLLYGIVKGFSNGIITEISNIISVSLAIYIGIHFSGLIHPYLSSEILSDYSKAIPLIAFLLVFIIILVIVKSIGELINKLTNQLALGLISRLLGGVFGSVKFLIISIFLISIATEYDLIDKKIQKNSILLIPMQRVSKIIMPGINKHKKTIIEVTKEGTNKAKKRIERKINSK